jgi:hypothetical protein
MRTSGVSPASGNCSGFNSARPRFRRLSGRITRQTIAFLIPLAMIAGVHCAKVGEPQPPELRVPMAATDLAARQQSDYIVLAFSKPERNTNGSEATTPKRVDVLRISEDPVGNATGMMNQDEFIEKAIRVLSIPATRVSEYLKDKTIVVQDHQFPDKSAMYQHTFRYAVLFINNKNQSAGLSNQLVITPVPIPFAPAGLTAEVTEHSIRLKWTAPSTNMDESKPPRIAGYSIYRSEEPNRFPPTPINSDPVQTPEFEDLNFGFDTTYYYAVSTVGSLQNPRAESLLSDVISVVSRDVFPPAPPDDFSAILQGDTVVLLWAPSPSEDMAGYRLYRQEKGTTALQQIQADLVRALSYRDSAIPTGKEYQYEIKAVDTHGNESPAVKADIEKR